MGRTVADRARRYEPYFVQSAARHEVDARLLWVIAYLETRFNPNAISRKSARGLMQFIPATAARFGLKDPHDPVAAIEAAAKYLRFLLLRYDGRTELALAAYNAGEAMVDAYLDGRAIQVGERVINPTGRTTGGIPPYRETRSYVARGMRMLGQIESASMLAASEPRLAVKRPNQPEKTKAAVNLDQPSQPQTVRKSISFIETPE